LDDELEPVEGPYDWYDVFKQNPDQTEFDWPPEANEAAAWILTEQAEEWLAIEADLG
jgi:hypothetical protein